MEGGPRGGVHFARDKVMAQTIKKTAKKWKVVQTFGDWMAMWSFTFFMASLNMVQPGDKELSACIGTFAIVGIVLGVACYFIGRLELGGSPRRSYCADPATLSPTGEQSGLSTMRIGTGGINSTTILRCTRHPGIAVSHAFVLLGVFRYAASMMTSLSAEGGSAASRNTIAG